MTFLNLAVKSSPRRRRSVLLALFFGYLVLAMLVVEQGRTIASQRQLIRSLFCDRVELTSLKIKHVHPRR